MVTNQRSDDGGNNRFDLWYSDTQLFRAACTTPNPAAQGGAARCPTAASWTNHQGGAHWDAGHLVFDTAVAVDACPRVYSTDGGAHTNTVNGNPGCHAPTWVRSNVGLHALWAWTMDGANRAGDAAEDLYFGNQDNGTFGTTTAGTNPPTWTNPNCCDTFDVLADPAWALGTTCCFGTGRFNRLELAAPGYTGNAEINTYPTRHHSRLHLRAANGAVRRQQRRADHVHRPQHHHQHHGEPDRVDFARSAGGSRTPAACGRR